VIDPRRYIAAKPNGQIGSAQLGLVLIAALAQESARAACQLIRPTINGRCHAETSGIGEVLGPVACVDRRSAATKKNGLIDWACACSPLSPLRGNDGGTRCATADAARMGERVIRGCRRRAWPAFSRRCVSIRRRGFDWASLKGQDTGLGRGFQRLRWKPPPPEWQPMLRRPARAVC